MFETLADSVIPFVRQYGYLVIFVFMFLETSMVFPLIPSEAAVPVSAGLLVNGPVTFCLFILAATAGATIGSVFAYYVFGMTSYEVADRYGAYAHVPPQDIDHARFWFRRWGESAVFWARLLPILRSLISIPAGFSDMELKKFIMYSAAGSAVSMIAFTGATYYGLQLIPWTPMKLFRLVGTYAAASPLLVLVVLGGLAVLSFFVWRAVDQYVYDLFDPRRYEEQHNR